MKECLMPFSLTPAWVCLTVGDGDPIEADRGRRFCIANPLQVTKLGRNLERMPLVQRANKNDSIELMGSRYHCLSKLLPIGSVQGIADTVVQH
jgi:hypothetical protein